MVPGPDGRRTQGGVEKAVRSELRRLGASVQTSGKAAVAVALARQVDTARGAVSAAAAALQLRLTLDDVTAEAKAARPVRDAIDELRDRRDAAAAAAG